MVTNGSDRDRLDIWRHALTVGISRFYREHPGQWQELLHDARAIRENVDRSGYPESVESLLARIVLAVDSEARALRISPYDGARCLWCGTSGLVHDPLCLVADADLNP